jgi:hypothetical protein
VQAGQHINDISDADQERLPECCEIVGKLFETVAVKSPLAARRVGLLPKRRLDDVQGQDAPLAGDRGRREWSMVCDPQIALEPNDVNWTAHDVWNDMPR